MIEEWASRHGNERMNETPVMAKLVRALDLDEFIIRYPPTDRRFALKPITTLQTSFLRGRAWCEV